MKYIYEEEKRTNYNMQRGERGERIEERKKSVEESVQENVWGEKSHFTVILSHSFFFQFTFQNFRKKSENRTNICTLFFYI